MFGLYFAFNPCSINNLVLSWFLNYANIVATCCLCAQDIRRFFQPTTVKPESQRAAPNGNVKTEEKKKKKNPSSSEEEVKRKKKETTKVSMQSLFFFASASFALLLVICLMSHFHRWLCFDTLQVNSSKPEEKRRDSEKKRKKHAVIESGMSILLVCEWF